MDVLAARRAADDQDLRARQLAAAPGVPFRGQA
jgi:hypothetical protein